MRKVGWIVGVIAGMVVALIVVVVVMSPSGSVATDEEGRHTLELAMLTVPVTDPEPVIESPDQFLGVPHLAPAFDTGDLGPDLTFRQDLTDIKPLDPDEVLRSVYLGHDSQGDPYHIWHSGSPDFRQMLGQIIADFGSFGRLGTSYGTLSTGDALWENSGEEIIAEMGLTTGSLTQRTGEPTVLTAEWYGLPQDVSAVVFYQDEEPIGWQTPISGTAALQVTYDDEDIRSFTHVVEMVALATDGGEWNRYALFR